MPKQKKNKRETKVPGKPDKVKITGNPGNLPSERIQDLYENNPKVWSESASSMELIFYKLQAIIQYLDEEHEEIIQKVQDSRYSRYSRSTYVYDNEGNIIGYIGG